MSNQNNPIEEILSLMQRMGERVHSFHPFDLARQKSPLIIKEGLIQTYPTDRVVDAVATNNNLWHKGRNNRLSILRNGSEPVYNGEIKIIYPNEKDENILIILPNSDNKVFDTINSHMLKYGWFNYKTEVTDDSALYYFEKKFGDRFTVEQLLNITDKIYHATSAVLKEKITKQGLIPKESKTPGFTNEPRIYFTPDMPSVDEAYEIVQMKGDSTQPIVVEVDLNYLKKSQAFFFDSRWANSIFTFEPIPNKAIRILTINDLPKFKLYEKTRRH